MICFSYIYFFNFVQFSFLHRIFICIHFYGCVDYICETVETEAGNFDKGFKPVQTERYNPPRNASTCTPHRNSGNCICFSLYIFVDSIKTICEQYHKRIAELEAQKYDFEYKVAIKDFEASKCVLSIIFLTHTLALNAHTHTHIIKHIYKTNKQSNPNHIQTHQSNNKNPLINPRIKPHCTQQAHILLPPKLLITMSLNVSFFVFSQTQNFARASQKFTTHTRKIDPQQTKKQPYR